MLLKLNERIQGVIAWVVIILIAITFTLFGVDYYLQSHQTNNFKAMVNDKPISNQAFEVNYRRAKAQQNLNALTATDEKALQNQVLDQMIATEVAVQAARQYGFEVTPEQANAAIVNIPQFQEDGHFSSQRFQQALSNAMFTPESFQKEVRQGMLLNQQRFAFMASSFALADEINKFVRLYMQTRDYDYLTISPDSFTKQVSLSPNEVEVYYQTHKKDFLTPEQVNVDYLSLSVNDIKSHIVVSDNDVKTYYEDNKNSFLIPAQWKVAHILFSIPAQASAEEIEKIQSKAEEVYQSLEKNPEQFKQFVKKYSEDKLSIADNGQLPWITAGDKEYDEALSNLSQPGQLSKPIKTKHGFEIFKLVDYKPVVTKPFKEVASAIKEQLRAEMAQAKYAKALETLTDLSYQTPDSLTAAADALNLKIQSSELFSRRGGQSPLTKNNLVINAAFNRDVLELGNNSEVIQLDNDKVIVLRVKEHQLAKEQALEAVQDKIKTLITQTKARDLAHKLGSELIKTTDTKKQEALIKANQLQWHTVKQASREKDNDNPAANELGFNILKTGKLDGTSLPTGDYLIVRLKQINNGDFNSLDKEQQASLIQHIESNFGIMDYDLYVNELIRHAKVEKH